MTDTQRMTLIKKHSIELTIQLEDGCRCGSCREWNAEAYWDSMKIGKGETAAAAIDDFAKQNNITIKE